MAGAGACESDGDEREDCGMDADRSGAGSPPPFGAEGLLAASGGRPPAAEPILRAPWPPLLLAGAIALFYLLQTLSGDPEGVAQRFGFSPADLERGRWGGLITALFVHGNWPHALLNGVMALATGTPIARLLGRGPVAAAAFFAFYLLCGALASLGFGALHLGGAVVLVGASGGVAGLMGASSRLIERRGALAPFTSRTVMGMAAAWVVVNLAVALVGLDFGAGKMPIAWEAHLVGYFVGLFLIGPLARLMRRDGEGV
jgi:membrane associated rhomboid family serine protease